MRTGKTGLKYKFLFLLVFTMAAFSAWCQPPVINPQTPSESNPVQIDPKSLSQPQLRSLLEDKNRETGKDKNADLLKNTKIDKDSVVTDNLKKNAYSPEDTYGANVFSQSARMDLSELSTPPLDYPIGVGDHIIVALWGAAEYQNSYVIARDGAIFPQGLGKIYVQGLTFENARNIIYSRFKSVVPAGTNIAISLGQPRTININVTGEVNKPGPYTVSAFVNAFTLIGMAGGTTEFGDLRSILIKRNGRVIDELDVYKYLTTGELGKHIYLENNDFVIVGTV